ncbi:patatin-like phospholipase family protein [Corynebacterium pelargi]|uniref:Patatin-like phospholipase n=1 Tax=Corynebacterium pelargi TaxID=1471400 RepID=A0A410W9P8_9CORY|nr:patatin family protein [Corynebacterium pelargi]QAU52684.1 Patatin-like phospholipase [Corynebacterium pelargi]
MIYNKEVKEAMHANDVALVIEGGGMRNAYTAGCIDQLLAHDIHFGWVGGVSAGASHTVNFLSHDRQRSRLSFVELASDPKSGGVKSMLRGKGYFNVEYIYETAGAPGGDIPFDWETFCQDPTPMCIAATRADTGENVYWGREDFADLYDLMRKARASSTLPGLMPVPEIDGVEYVDGALGESGGLLIQAAMDAGFEKFLVLRSKPRGYIRPELSKPAVVRKLLRKRPVVAEAMIKRPARYNAEAKKIDQLEAQGQAMVFYPEHLSIENTERNREKLEHAWNCGVEQTKREWDSWMEFLS